MSFKLRSKRNGSRRTMSSRRTNAPRRGAFEMLEARLALAADLGFAGAFEILGGPAAEIYTSSGHMQSRGGGMVTDVAGNRYVTVNGTYDHIVDLDPGPAVQAVTTDAALVKLDPNGAPVWSAALNATASGSPVVRILQAVDDDQNVYMVGDFRGTVDFDPGPGVLNRTSSQAGAEFSVYMAKLNSAGQFLWVRTLEGSALRPDRFVVDGDGNLVIASNFASGSAIDLDPGPGAFLAQPVGTNNLLVHKYSTNGDFVWARQFGGVGVDMVSTVPSLAVDGQGDVYIGRGFKAGSLDLDPGAGVYMATNNDDATDGFVVKLDAVGEFQWAYVTEGFGGAQFRDIEIAGDGSIVVSGYLKGDVDFQPGSGTLQLASVGIGANGLAIKLNSDASVAWARRFGSQSAGHGETLVMEADVDQQGNVYLGGSFGRLAPAGQTFDFDPGPDVYELLMPSTQETGYVLSLTESGDFRWAVPLGGNAGLAQVQGVSATADGSVQLSGAFEGSADFDPDLATQYLINSGTDQSVFVATLTQAEPDPGAPVVDAGDGQTILITGTVSLDGTVADDGLPNSITTAWSMHSGPGTVAFGNAAALDTTAAFSKIGSYVLKLEATDGQFTTADYVHVIVNPLTAALNATADAYIDNSTATTNYGASASLLVHGKPDDAALLTWNLSSIPAGSALQSATFTINVTNTSVNTYEIYELKRSWTESQATWKKATTGTNWQSAGAQGSLDRGTTVLGTVSPVPYEPTATGLRTVTLNAAGLAVVQGWINDPATNFGFVVQDYANANQDDLAFSSKDAPVAADRPQLQVVYVPPASDPAPRIDALLASPERVSAGAPITLTAVREDDSTHEFQTVSVYRDNGDGVLVVGEDALVGTDTNPLLGLDYTSWTVTAETTGLAPGAYKFFAQASNAMGDAQASLDVEVFGVETVNFASTNVPKAIPNQTTITSTILVPGGFTILDVDVTLDITHTNDADLDVYLISPGGTRVALFTDVGGAGDNFSGTVLDDEAATAIASGAAPFAGRFRSQGSLSAMDGQNSAGLWTLEVTDDLKKNTGTLNSWSLQFTREATPMALAGGASLLGLPVETQLTSLAVGKAIAAQAAPTSPSEGAAVGNAGSSAAANSPAATLDAIVGSKARSKVTSEASDGEIAAVDMAFAGLGTL